MEVALARVVVSEALRVEADEWRGESGIYEHASDAIDPLGVVGDVRHARFPSAIGKPYCGLAGCEKVAVPVGSFPERSDAVEVVAVDGVVDGRAVPCPAFPPRMFDYPVASRSLAATRPRGVPARGATGAPFLDSFGGTRASAA